MVNRMKINPQRCVGCALCLPYCPEAAITMSREKKAVINRDKCIECAVCYNSSVCPVDAFEIEKLEYPRSVREVFATVYKTHGQTNVPGRGTEEMKTNDVTGRFKLGEIGFSVDMGRPGVGVDLVDAEKVTMALAKLGVEFEPENPITFLMKDVKTGELKEEVKGERVHSCIPEFKTKLEKMSEILDTLEEVSQKINSVFSLGCCIKLNPDGSIPEFVLQTLKDKNISYYPDAKTNIGLGRPLAE